MSELNSEQLKAVNQEKNAVVAAGAGSGKTFVLAERYAHLVIDKNYSVDQILTLTFTNKAASEMYQRIYKRLSEEVKQNPSNLRAKQAVENFVNARIQTLDSYSANIVKAASRFYGIKPDFVVDDTKCTEFANKEALPFMLNHRNNKALIELIKTNSFEEIATSLFAKTVCYYTNIAQNLDFSDLLQKQTEYAMQVWNISISIIENAISMISKIVNELGNNSKLKMILSLSELISTCNLDNPPNIVEVVEFYKNNRSSVEHTQLKEYLSTLTKFTKISKTGNTSDESVTEVKKQLDVLRNELPHLLSIATFICHYKTTQEIYPLLQEFLEKFNNFKRSSGILTFSDVSSLAVEILINHPEIRLIEKKSFKAIMIDEFQDNNQKQRDLLFMLAENFDRMEKSVPSPSELLPDKLFFVGDEKQSIYKFRGADVSVFRKLKTELQTSNNDESNIQLITNYRSEPALIAAFNSIFGGFEYPKNIAELEKPTNRNIEKPTVFLQESQLTTAFPIFEASYDWVKPSLYDKDKKPKQDSLDPLVHIALLNTTKTNDAQEEEIQESSNQNDAPTTIETQALYIAHSIKELLDSKKYTSKDCAILLRTTTHQYVYEKQLRSLGIPYTSEAVVGFFGQTPMNNLYYLLRLLVYPTDLVAYENVLFSPFVNLSEQGVNFCMMNFQSLSDFVLFDERLENNLNTDDLEKYKIGRQKFTALQEKIKSLSVVQAINELWYNQGQRYEAIWNDTVSLYHEMYDYLFELARKTDNDGLGLSDFVNTLEKVKAENSKLSDMDIPMEKPDAVRIMTIHKSKGLEFPVVFIGECASETKSSQSGDVVYFDNEYGISLNTKSPSWFPSESGNFFFTLTKDQMYLQEEAEIRRLLYVAMTRAEKELYLISSYSFSQKIEDICTELLLSPTQENLLLLCSNLAANKREMNKNASRQLTPKYCITNHTFWNLLLFPISSYHSDEVKIQNLPFTLEDIKTELQNKIAKNAKTASFHQNLSQILSFAKEKYQESTIINTPQIESKYISPSSMHNFDFDLTKQSNKSTTYPGIEEIISSLENKSIETSDSNSTNTSLNKGFGYNDFGTIAHAFVESAFTHTTPNIPSQVIASLSEKERKTIFSIAEKMAEKFMSSELGLLAQKAQWIKNEYSFKLFLPTGTKIYDYTFEADKIVNGQIDLIFEHNDEVIIVDFKTDSVENPKRHREQLLCYKLASSELRKKDISKIHTFLYYFRTGNHYEL